jgi:8-oxo-dGTP diphosphatase
MGDPRRRIDKAAAEAWAALDDVRAMPGSDAKSDNASHLMREMREVSDGASAVLRAEMLRVFDAEKLSVGRLAKRYGISKTRAYQIVKDRNKLAIDEEEDIVTESATKPEPQPVVAAIVTNGMGVLIGRRNDGKPPWTFIAGEIEPGESPEDAGVREVKEETGLLVHATSVIGRRVHPKTGRTMIYMSAEPSGSSTRVFVGDPEELAEVRWATLAEADDLLPGMFEPVREHLVRKIGD